MAYDVKTPLVGGTTAIYDAADTNAERQAQGTQQAAVNDVLVFTGNDDLAGTRLNALNSDFDATLRGTAKSRPTDVTSIKGHLYNFKYFSDTV